VRYGQPVPYIGELQVPSVDAFPGFKVLLDQLKHVPVCEKEIRSDAEGSAHVFDPCFAYGSNVSKEALG
jgi:hypothetical protein